MLLQTDVSATFHPSTIPGSRSLGVGQLNVCGIIISFTVYPSNFGQGFLISYPSKPAIKNGVQELDAKGKPKYFNEVYVSDINSRAIIENAVLSAMQNKGVVVQQPVQQGYQQPYQQPQQTYQQPAHQAAPQQFINGQGVTPQANPNSFGQPSNSFAAPAPQASSGIQGSSIVVDDLPF